MDLPKKYTISQAGKILGVSSKTLRRWEKAGKITPKRTPTGNRFFTQEDLDNLKNLSSSKTYSVGEAAKRLGVSAKTIRRWDKAGKVQIQRDSSGNRVFQEKDITLLKSKTFSPVLPKPKNYHVAALGLVIALVALGYFYYMLSFNDKFIPSPKVLGANSQDFVSGIRQKIGEFILSFLPENYKVQVITQNIPQNTQNIKFANSLTLGSDLNVQGQAILSDVNISKSLNVQGSTTLNDLSATSLTTTGNATIGGTINGVTLTNNKLIFSGDAPSIYPTTTNSSISLNSNGSGAINIGDQSKGDIYLGGGSGSGLHCIVTSSNGSFYCSGDITTSGNLKVNGGSITTGATAFNLLNETATNINFAGATTTLSIGSTSGTTTVNNNLTATGTTTLSSTLGVTGTTSLNGAVNIGSLSSNDVAVNGRITTSIVPKLTANVDLGTSSLKFNNLYTQTINTSGTNTSGQATFNQDPPTTAIVDSSVFINPTTAVNTGAALLGFGIAGVEKARIDNQGNIILGYSSNVASVATDPFNVYNHGTTRVANITTAGNLSLSGSATAVGVNSGSGLIQGTGGITVTGTASFNTTGTASTSIGNSTGTFAVTSSGGFNVDTTGTVSGVKSIAFTSANPGGATLTGDTLTLQSFGRVFIDTATAQADRSIGIGNTNSTGVFLARTGQLTTVQGSATIAQTLTASNGFTQTTGALSLTSTSGSAALTLTSSATAFNVNSGLFDIDTSNSRVGIGTAGPGSLLDIQGAGNQKLVNVQASSTGTGYIYSAASNTGGSLAYGVERSTGGGVFVGSSAYASVFGSTNATAIQLATNNNVRLTIDSSGNVSMGTTTPASNFDLFATTMSNTSTVASYTASKTTTTVTATAGTFTAADIGRFFVWNDGTIDRITGFTSSTQVTVATSGTEASQSATTRSANLYVNSSGLVGIQNTNPVANLDIRTTSLTNHGIAVHALNDGTDNQTGNLFEAYNGFGGNPFFAVDPHSSSIKLTATDNAWIQGFFGNSMWSYNSYSRNIGGSGAVYDKSQAASQIRQDLNGKIYLSVAPSGTAGNLITWTDALTVNNDGSILLKDRTNSTTAFQVQPLSSTTPVLDVDTTNSFVGIGTATPSTILDIVKTVAGSVGPVIQLENNGTNGGEEADIQFSDVGTVRNKIGFLSSPGGTSNVSFYTITNGGSLTERMRINVSGVGIGTASLVAGGGLTVAPSAVTSGSPSLLTVTGPADTTLTASTEANDVNLNLARTVQFATGSLTTQRAAYIQAPSYGFVGASTLTTAATLDISGAPKSQTNATITNSYGLNIEAGAVQPAGTVTSAYGLSVNAPTGASNNYAAIFQGGNVGIGTTSPSQQLEVKNSSSSGASIIANFINSAPVWTGVQIQADQSNGTGIVSAVASGANAQGLQLRYQNSSGVSTQALTIDTSGNIGIGTAAPDKRLHVAGPNTDVGLVITTPSSNGVEGTDFTGIDFGYSGTDASKLVRLVAQTVGGGGGNFYIQTPTTGVNDSYTTKLEIDRQGFAIFNSTATTSTLSYKGVQVNTTLPASATTWTDVTGLKVNASSLGASSLVTNFYGAYIDQTNLNTHTTGSTIGYGLYINTPANGNKDYGLYTTAGSPNNSAGGFAISIAGAGGGTGSNLAIGTDNNGVSNGQVGNEIAIANFTGSAPSATASQGFIYVNAGALKYQGPSTLTTLANADYAESMPFVGELNQGEIASVSDTKKNDSDLYNNFLVERATKAYDDKIIGVVSSASPETGAPTRQIALVGRVPVKVTNESGNIKTGDYLTSSATKPGYAMKATKAGRVIGVALQALNSTTCDPSTQVSTTDFGLVTGGSCSTGKILVFVNPSYYDPDSQLKTADSFSIVNSNQNYQVNDSTGSQLTRVGIFSDAVIGNLKVGSIDSQSLTLLGNKLESLIGLKTATSSAQLSSQPVSTDPSILARLDDLSSRLSFLEKSASVSAVLSSSTSPSSTSSASFDDLTVSKKLTTNDLGITGNISAGLLSIIGLEPTLNASTINTLSGDLYIQNLAVAGVNFLNGKVLIDKTGDVTVQNKITAQKVEASEFSTSKAAGSSVLPANTASVDVTAPNANSTARILITPTSLTDKVLTVTKKTDGKFTVSVKQTDPVDINFDWFVLNQ